MELPLNTELVVGKTEEVKTWFGVIRVTPVKLGDWFEGRVLSREGLEFLDFSQYSPYAFFPWPLKEGQAERIAGQLFETVFIKCVIIDGSSKTERNKKCPRGH